MSFSFDFLETSCSKFWIVYVWNKKGSFSIDEDLDLRDWTLSKIALLFEMIEVLAKLLELYNNQFSLKRYK